MSTNQQLDTFLKYFNVYKQRTTDTLSLDTPIQNLLSKKDDLDYIMSKVGITKYKPHITYRKLLTKIGIKL